MTMTNAHLKKIKSNIISSVLFIITALSFFVVATINPLLKNEEFNLIIKEITINSITTDETSSKEYLIINKETDNIFILKEDIEDFEHVFIEGNKIVLRVYKNDSNKVVGVEYNQDIIINYKERISKEQLYGKVLILFLSIVLIFHVFNIIFLKKAYKRNKNDFILNKNDYESLSYLDKKHLYRSIDSNHILHKYKKKMKMFYYSIIIILLINIVSIICILNKLNLLYFFISIVYICGLVLIIYFGYKKFLSVQKKLFLRYYLDYLNSSEICEVKSKTHIYLNIENKKIFINDNCYYDLENLKYIEDTLEEPFEEDIKRYSLKLKVVQSQVLYYPAIIVLICSFIHFNKSSEDEEPYVETFSVVLTNKLYIDLKNKLKIKLDFEKAFRDLKDALKRI